VSSSNVLSSLIFFIYNFFLFSRRPSEKVLYNMAPDGQNDADDAVVHTGFAFLLL
jgi:hypothetical protein